MTSLARAMELEKIVRQQKKEILQLQRAMKTNLVATRELQTTIKQPQTNQNSKSRVGLAAALLLKADKTEVLGVMEDLRYEMTQLSRRFNVNPKGVDGNNLSAILERKLDRSEFATFRQKQNAMRDGTRFSPRLFSQIKHLVQTSVRDIVNRELKEQVNYELSTSVDVNKLKFAVNDLAQRMQVIENYMQEDIRNKATVALTSTKIVEPEANSETFVTQTIGSLEDTKEKSTVNKGIQTLVWNQNEKNSKLALTMNEKSSSDDSVKSSESSSSSSSSETDSDEEASHEFKCSEVTENHSSKSKNLHNKKIPINKKNQVSIRNEKIPINVNEGDPYPLHVVRIGDLHNDTLIDHFQRVSGGIKNKKISREKKTTSRQKFGSAVELALSQRNKKTSLANTSDQGNEVQREILETLHSNKKVLNETVESLIETKATLVQNTEYFNNRFKTITENIESSTTKLMKLNDKKDYMQKDIAENKRLASSSLVDKETTQKMLSKLSQTIKYIQAQLLTTVQKTGNIRDDLNNSRREFSIQISSLIQRLNNLELDKKKADKFEIDVWSTLKPLQLNVEDNKIKILQFQTDLQNESRNFREEISSVMYELQRKDKFYKNIISGSKDLNSEIQYEMEYTPIIESKGIWHSPESFHDGHTSRLPQDKVNRNDEKTQTSSQISSVVKRNRTLNTTRPRTAPPTTIKRRTTKKKIILKKSTKVPQIKRGNREIKTKSKIKLKLKPKASKKSKAKF